MNRIGAAVAGMLGLAAAGAVAAPLPVLVEAESFEQTGGWVVDQQFMDQMGSPFLLAHGLGEPVADATTTVKFPAAGTYRVWVRTRDWVGPWKTADTPPALEAQGSPGVFKLVVAGRTLDATFGAEGADWHWQDGGTVEIPSGGVRLAIHDLTGFDGRCDAILFSDDPAFTPPVAPSELAAARRVWLGLPDRPEAAGSYDLVVVGGGFAGTCAAVSAARLGLKVALIQDRPVLGGNASSEIRVGPQGEVGRSPWTNLGRVVAELTPAKRANVAEAAVYEDARKLEVVRAEKNIALFLETHVDRVERKGGAMAAVVGRNVRTGKELRFEGRWFADCTGDATVGVLAAADFRYGREGREETGESLAPVKPDRQVMGSSILWSSAVVPGAPAFPECPWALRFTEQTCQHATKGDWNWETGMRRDQIVESERIRDYGLRAVFGNWAFQRNRSARKAEYADRKLDWVAYVAGKRESRRLLGDVILAEQDIDANREFSDACVATTWKIDLHYPEAKNLRDFPDEPFRSRAEFKQKAAFAIPYRCFYSRNVPNLFMAGRNISVTHVALGTVRVMRTGGMMGEVVGMAASICKRHAIDPRGVFQDHLDELKALLGQGVPKQAMSIEPSAGR